ncbi:DNA-3-methyladenine glycosylase family protein [Amphritea balenae]|uniref:DNA-3-methyladenine glycosylase II n=1 Tax=Amphritea balenae TaxID=452629 RepID=A0A3P1SWJ8_9GAMM|nr:DNA-3-methyladenine glycosylase [Amphritea balenae]RRD01597.1 DNA-3-methyladenine glycosylase 2 family protein [Amphritea balenae]GGK55658.1 DNA-3-methyladenine glycosylase II [Amphritea balenae]
MDQQCIDDALTELAKVDTDIARALPQVGSPAPRLRPSGFAALLAIIIGQQVSTEAAAAIRGRVETLLGDVSANQLLFTEDQALRDAGLSWRKVEYANGLAEAINNGTLDLAVLPDMNDDEAISAISSLRGFGRWSAEIYLMFSLRRQDIFPADDLALLVALGRLKRLEEKPTPKQARQMIEHWAPYRSAGSLFLWHYYRGAPA